AVAHPVAPQAFAHDDPERHGRHGHGDTQLRKRALQPLDMAALIDDVTAARLADLVDAVGELVAAVLDRNRGRRPGEIAAGHIGEAGQRVLLGRKRRADRAYQLSPGTGNGAEGAFMISASEPRRGHLRHTLDHPRSTGRPMTDASLPAKPFVENDFRIGRVFSRTSSVLSRNLLIFFVVTVIANLPGTLLLKNAGDAAANSNRAMGMAFLGALLTLALGTFSQAVVLYGAFQDMRGRRVSLAESLKVGFSRLLAVVGLAILMSLGVGFGFVLLIIPGILLLTM